MGRCMTSAEAMSAVGDAAGRVAPRLCYLQFGQGGPAIDWAKALGRAAALGFDSLCIAPIFATERNPFLVADLEATSPALGLPATTTEAVAKLAALCAAHKLRLVLDVALDRLAADGPSARQAYGLYEGRDPGSVIDPRTNQPLIGAVMARGGVDDQLAGWWSGQLGRLAKAGAAGFRLVGLERVSAHALGRIVQTTRAAADCRFWAWTPGLDWSRHAGLVGLGLDGVFASTPWWDGRADWYLQERESLRRIAPVIGLASFSALSMLSDGIHRSLMPPETTPLSMRSIGLAAHPSPGGSRSESTGSTTMTIAPIVSSCASAPVGVAVTA